LTISESAARSHLDRIVEAARERIANRAGVSVASVRCEWS
jgi:hypothetical protein